MLCVHVVHVCCVCMSCMYVVCAYRVCISCVCISCVHYSKNVGARCVCLCVYRVHGGCGGYARNGARVEKNSNKHPLREVVG